MTVFEVISPLFFALLLLFIRGLADSKYIDNDTTWNPVYPHLMNRPASKTKLFFTPNNTFTNDIMSKVLSSTNVSGKILFVWCTYNNFRCF